MSSDASGLGRILGVDDEEPVRDVLCEYFESQGFSVEAALVLRRIRRAAPELPVIMVTANEDVALAREVLTLASAG
jgi:CheY-like chemotaxis protein